MNILLVCTGNICRSPMAEGLLRQAILKRGLSGVHVHSAGTHGLDGQPAAPSAVQAAAAMGVDITAHRARSLDREMVRKADLILVMEPYHREIIGRALPPGDSRTRLLADFERPRGSDAIADPYQQPLAVYQVCIDRIARCLEGVVGRLSADRGSVPAGHDPAGCR